VRAQDLMVIVTSAGTEEQALDIAHALGKLTVAEGVEDEATLQAIREWADNDSGTTVLARLQPVRPAVAPRMDSPNSP